MQASINTFGDKERSALIKDDTDDILALTEGVWEEFRGKKLFITGGTGFFGKWFLESFAAANERFDLNASITILTRDAPAFERKALHLAKNPDIRFHSGDVRSFEFPKGTYSHIIHAAAQFIKTDPSISLETIVEGTRHTLDFAAHAGARKFLLVSSGAVYGPQPHDMARIPEECFHDAAMSDPGSEYGRGKREAERMCSDYAAEHGIEIKIARCFSFVGPYLPLDAHFAIGNFIRDGLSGRPIVVAGDGTPIRSYLYASDLAAWLWTILTCGQSLRAYNVGSETAVSIAELARLVAKSFNPNIQVDIAKTLCLGRSPERYVPSNKRAQKELGLEERIDLQEAITRTIHFSRHLDRQ